MQNRCFKQWVKEEDNGEGVKVTLDRRVCTPLMQSKDLEHATGD